MNWYIVRSQANRERKVSERLIKEGKKVQREKVIFPGYIFVECSAIGELKQVVKSINGATGLLTDRTGEIQIVKEQEVNRMIGLHEENKNKNFADIFSVGDEVTITEGPFASFKGAIDFIDKDKGKLKVNVSIFGRITVVELNEFQVKK